ncbi:MAG: tetratricopeptide repeat protein [Myxococcaceae bacterium]|nr:tetratricopeptide repeat protein [Myxococcaceae bacterium]
MRFALLSLCLASSVLAQAPAEPTLSLADLEKGCRQGDTTACVDLGFNLEAKEPEKAVAVYRDACKKNVLAACSNLSLMLRDARGAPKNLAEAATLAKKACDGKNAPGCFHLGLVKDAANDFAGATKAYEASCRLQVFQGCTNFAINLIKGVGVAADPQRGLELLETACAESVKKGAQYPSLRSCLVLGQLYEQGTKGVVANLDAAKRLYKVACYGGLDEACKRLGAGGHQDGDGHGH